MSFVFRLHQVTVLVLVVGIVGFQPGALYGSSLRDQMIEKAKKEGEFVVAGSNADNFRDELKGFKKRYPFLKLKAFAGNTADTINRIVAESKAGKLSFDLPAVSSDGEEILAKANLLVKHEFPHLRDFASGTQPKHGLYIKAFLNPRVQGVYNTKLVSPKDIPKSWEEMTDPKWTGKTMLSRSSEEMPAQMAYFWSKGGKLNWERSFDFFTKLAKQKPMIGRGYRGGIKRVAAGEVPMFWFGVVGPASRMYFKGAPIGLVAFPRFSGTFRNFGILKGAKHPSASWLLIDYLTSPEGQHEYTEVISAKVPVNKKAKAGKLGKWLTDNDITVDNTTPMDVELMFDTKIQKKSETFFFKLLGIK